MPGLNKSAKNEMNESATVALLPKLNSPAPTTYQTMQTQEEVQTSVSVEAMFASAYSQTTMEVAESFKKNVESTAEIEGGGLLEPKKKKTNLAWHDKRPAKKLQELLKLAQTEEGARNFSATDLEYLHTSLNYNTFYCSHWSAHYRNWALSALSYLAQHRQRMPDKTLEAIGRLLNQDDILAFEGSWKRTASEVAFVGSKILAIGVMGLLGGMFLAGPTGYALFRKQAGHAGHQFVVRTESLEALHIIAYAIMNGQTLSSSVAETFKSVVRECEFHQEAQRHLHPMGYLFFAALSKLGERLSEAELVCLQKGLVRFGEQNNRCLSYYRNTFESKDANPKISDEVHFYHTRAYTLKKLYNKVMKGNGLHKNEAIYLFDVKEKVFNNPDPETRYAAAQLFYQLVTSGFWRFSWDDKPVENSVIAKLIERGLDDPVRYIALTYFEAATLMLESNDYLTNKIQAQFKARLDNIKMSVERYANHKKIYIFKALNAHLDLLHDEKLPGELRIWLKLCESIYSKTKKNSALQQQANFLKFRLTKNFDAALQTLRIYRDATDNSQGETKIACDILQVLIDAGEQKASKIPVPIIEVLGDLLANRENPTRIHDLCLKALAGIAVENPAFPKPVLKIVLREGLKEAVSDSQKNDALLVLGEQVGNDVYYVTLSEYQWNIIKIIPFAKDKSTMQNAYFALGKYFKAAKTEEFEKLPEELTDFLNELADWNKIKSLPTEHKTLIVLMYFYALQNPDYLDSLTITLSMNIPHAVIDTLSRFLDPKASSIEIISNTLEIFKYIVESKETCRLGPDVTGRLIQCFDSKNQLISA